MYDIFNLSLRHPNKTPAIGCGILSFPRTPESSFETIDICFHRGDNPKSAFRNKN